MAPSNFYAIHNKSIFSVVQYGPGTWPINSREECKLWVFERNNFEVNIWVEKEENGKWRKFNNEELQSSCSQDD